MVQNHSAALAAAAAAAATAAGEMYLLNASDTQGSGASSDTLTPPFAAFAAGAANVSYTGARPGLAAAVTAAATNAADAYLVEQARRETSVNIPPPVIPPPAPPPILPQSPTDGHDETAGGTSTTSLLGSVAPDDTFHFTDLDAITRGDGSDDFAVFGNLDLSSFDPVNNANNGSEPHGDGWNDVAGRGR